MRPLGLLATLILAAPATAAETTYLLTVEHTDFSKSFGSRREVGFEVASDLGSTTLVGTLAHGTRDFGTRSYSAINVQGKVYHDWTSKLSSRSAIAISSNDPVFPSLDASHDFNLKIVPKAVATAGVRLANYVDGGRARSVYLGGTYYFRGGLATYRFSALRIDRHGRSSGHMLNLQIKDSTGMGLSQLWLGTGSSLQAFELGLAPGEGRFNSVFARRVQPLAGSVALTAGIGAADYRTKVGNYHGYTGMLGIQLLNRPKARSKP